MKIMKIEEEKEKEKKEKKVDIMKIIKDLGGSFGKDNESQMKASQLIKGLALSDDPKSNEFMKKLDIATTEISKEMTSEKKEDKKKSEAIVVEQAVLINKKIILEEGDSFRLVKESIDSTSNHENGK